MANPGVGNKFVSVNLNKSYGQSSHNHANSYGSNRGRPGGYGGGGGMVVLSRPRSAQKTGQKLSVPPPLNLPSLRKEHERFDSIGHGSGASGGGVSGTGARPSSSGMSWTKPAAIGLQEKDDVPFEQNVQDVHTTDGMNVGSGMYSSRSGVSGEPTSASGKVFPPQKASVLRGEDFPSLQATLPAASGPTQKHKDAVGQKNKQGVGDVSVGELKDGSRLSFFRDSQPRLQSALHDAGDGQKEIGSKVHGLATSRTSKQHLKQDDYFAGPLPLVRLNPRSDWADDERDTGHGFMDRGKDSGMLRNETFWDRDFDLPRAGLLPHKPTHNVFDKRGQRDSEGRRLCSSEIRHGNDFHDPIRESFEAELERAQKAQEQERQRIIEEQERAIQLARRDEEERVRLAREAEERQRKLEEEAREAAWKAEQERLEVIRRAEEQRIAREEEKRRIFVEEERRKQAAKQKLLELEEKIAKREAAVTTAANSPTLVDDKMPGIVKDSDPSGVADLGDWDDGERMDERITISTSSGSAGLIRTFEMDAGAHFLGDGSSTFSGKRKTINSWRNDACENENSASLFMQHQDDVHQSPIQDASVGGRAYSNKDFYGGPRFTSSRSYNRAGVPGSYMHDNAHLKGQRCNVSVDGDYYRTNSEIESEYHENFAERFDDLGWGQSRSLGNSYPPYPERPYPNNEAEGLYSFGRSRNFMRQPRVLPPPSFISMQKTSDNEHSGASTFLEREMEYGCPTRGESATQYGSSHRECDEQQEIFNSQLGETDGATKLGPGATLRCDSQSSLSVSSPPTSPTHLSHDDLDGSGNSPLLLTPGEEKSLPQGSESIFSPSEAHEKKMVATSGAAFSSDDEDWTVENAEHLQEQEEYGDEDGYQEEAEAHERDDDNMDLNQEFNDMQLEEKILPCIMDNVVLGFNEGVEVSIPNDDIERSSRNEEMTFSMSHDHIGTVEKLGSFDGLHTDGSLQAVDNHSDRKFQEMDKAVQNLVIHPSNGRHSSSLSSVSSSEVLSHVAASTCSQSAQHTGRSSDSIAAHSLSTQSVTSSILTIPRQVEVPVKLQFGLFSGPSLMPSPVPAIQIGSIQMPLQLHPQVGTSLTQLHPSQPPLFQFGQLRYTSPISPGVLPLAGQSVSFVQPSVPVSFSLNQNPAGSFPVQHGQASSAHYPIEDKSSCLSVDNQTSLISSHLDLLQGNISKEEGHSLESTEKVLPLKQYMKQEVLPLQDQDETSHIYDNSNCESSLQGGHGQHDSFVMNRKSSPNATKLAGQAPSAVSSFKFKEKESNWQKVQGPISSDRGKRYVYSVKPSGSKPSFHASDSSWVDSSKFQRRHYSVQRPEFRVRQTSDRRQSAGPVSNSSGVDNKPNINGKDRGNLLRSGSRKVVLSKKSRKQVPESQSPSIAPTEMPEIDSGGRSENLDMKEAVAQKQRFGEGSLKRNDRFEDDIDAPLQSGVVRVFEQPGIEAHSDEGDFIEVRSKRQMLNDRRVQREKETKAKARAPKVSRRRSSNINEVSALVTEGTNSIHSAFVASKEDGSTNIEISGGINIPTGSQPLSPIGTPATKMDGQSELRSQKINSLQTGFLPSGSREDTIGPGSIFDTKDKVIENFPTSLCSWGNSQNQQVMGLTQTQLDEAMTGQSVIECTSSVGESSIPSSSIMAKEKLFSSAASPINSLLAGEKIQFGAVTSPTILPSSSRASSHSIGPVGAGRSDINGSHNLSATENGCNILFDKEKNQSESCAQIEDCEAEAAASAVAVAAINNDENTGNGLGNCSGSFSDAKNIQGIAGDQQIGSQSRTEEPLSVSLPADLSVENSPISLWQPLLSPQNSSSHMLSHFPAGTPSHFPYYEMNPMLRGPVLAFGPHEGSGSTQSQSQKSNAIGSGPGTWQQCPSNVDSFYSPHAGFAGPFISPPGGIHGVQGAPQMFLYNHFAPVGQFGQVGLSFMGTTYFPSGKQPDWKHNPASSTMSLGERDKSNLNTVASQPTQSNMPAPLQHLAPGSPLLPVASPLGMFDVSSIQSALDAPAQSRWSRVSASPLQSVPPTMPLQQQQSGGTASSQFSMGMPFNQPLNVESFQESQTSTSFVNDNKFTVSTNSIVTQLPDELGLVQTSNNTCSGASVQCVTKNLTARPDADTAKVDTQGGSSSRGGQNTSSAFKHQKNQQRKMTAQQHNSSRFGHPRGGGVSQKSGSGAECSHVRMNFHARSQSGAGKGLPPLKMKQIYVAKQNTTGTSVTS